MKYEILMQIESVGFEMETVDPMLIWARIRVLREDFEGKLFVRELLRFSREDSSFFINIEASA